MRWNDKLFDVLLEYIFEENYRRKNWVWSLNHVTCIKFYYSFLQIEKLETTLNRNSVALNHEQCFPHHSENPICCIFMNWGTSNSPVGQHSIKSLADGGWVVERQTFRQKLRVHSESHWCHHFSHFNIDICFFCKNE